MNFPKYTLEQQKGRGGEVYFESYVVNELKCIYHKNDTAKDYGIDGFVEVVIDNAVTGKRIAIQIKHGNSYFAKDNMTPKGHKYYDNQMDRLGYYLNVNTQTPVFLILMNDDYSSIYWVKLQNNIIDFIGVGWRIEIPVDNNLKLHPSEFYDEILKSVKPIENYHFAAPPSKSYIKNTLKEINEMAEEIRRNKEVNNE